MNIYISDNAKFILDLLKSKGFKAYIVGGSVRDIIIDDNNIPDDYDFATDANPDQILDVFKDYNTYEVGKKFGTISVLIDDAKYEITTFRKESDYNDNRHPSSVVFTDSLKEDVSRRDFTINAIAYNFDEGIVDHYFGIDDIKNRVIRCVGDPDERFNEDALRILRAIRFSASLDFEIEEKTKKSIFKNKELLNNIPVERITQEFNKFLCIKSIYKILDEYREVFSVFIPELKTMFEFEQITPYHKYDLWHHTIHSVENIRPDLLLRMTMLLHDLGKVTTRVIDKNGRTHFKGHPKESVYIAGGILNRLKYSKSFINDVLILIDYHDDRFNGNNIEIKECMKVLGIPLMMNLIDVQIADFSAQSDYLYKERFEIIENTIKEVNKIISENQCFSFDTLEINGDNLINLGIPEGENIGIILNDILNKVIYNELENQHDILIEFVKDIYI